VRERESHGETRAEERRGADGVTTGRQGLASCVAHGASFGEEADWFLLLAALAKCSRLRHWLSRSNAARGPRSWQVNS
jgi:hypothetical protein